MTEAFTVERGSNTERERTNITDVLRNQWEVVTLTVDFSEPQVKQAVESSPYKMQKDRGA